MEQTVRKIGGCSVTVYILNTVIVGSGAAGLNAADRLFEYGNQEIAVVTEGLKRGTSRNTGSDKQTYYKLSLSGSTPDSVYEMAETLFDGGCIDGDIALCEAALSTQSFFKLVEAGVPFPHNRFGEYIGYKTDHDPKCRATSAGPYTSRMMTECLEKSVLKKGIRIFDGLQVIKILREGNHQKGILCLNLKWQDKPDKKYVAFFCENTVWATGGPAGIYADSVYPFGQYGASGTAFEAGVAGRNLTEWQYGISSIKPRWNVSGTYMQVLPRMISTNQDGNDEREFLNDFFNDKSELLSKLFLKGYQWPFDVRKVSDGSSIIDILVYLETRKNRRVFLDFRKNPLGKDFDFELLCDEAKSYLEKAGACFGTPIERLSHMNAPAVSFYLDKGVDLYEKPLEVALCAQHNNGGLAVDSWWQTNIKGFFCVGEAAGTHGIYRPGGSALNSGQVGSTRAAQYISKLCTGIPEREKLPWETLNQACEECESLCSSSLSDKDTVTTLWSDAARNMSRFGAAFRSCDGLREALEKTEQKLKSFSEIAYVPSPVYFQKLFRLKDILICQQVYLKAMLNYIDHGGESRGSALYKDQNGKKPYADLPDDFCYRVYSDLSENEIQEVIKSNQEFIFSWRKVHPIPREDDFFENVWKKYRENGNIG